MVSYPPGAILKEKLLHISLLQKNNANPGFSGANSHLLNLFQDGQCGRDICLFVILEEADPGDTLVSG
jgi:hypothetical protein